MIESPKSVLMYCKRNTSSGSSASTLKQSFQIVYPNYIPIVQFSHWPSCKSLSQHELIFVFSSLLLAISPSFNSIMTRAVIFLLFFPIKTWYLMCLQWHPTHDTDVLLDALLQAFCNMFWIWINSNAQGICKYSISWLTGLVILHQL